MDNFKIEKHIFVVEDDDLFNQDANLLLCIFPREIWCTIISQLKYRFSDLENTSNSSPFLRDLAAPLRAEFLFKKVIQVVSPKIWKTDEERSGSPISEVFKWRLVSSQWNVAVDDLLLESFEFFKLEQLNNTLQSKITNQWYERCLDLFGFSEHFQETHPNYRGSIRSPFVGNKLKLNEAYSNDFQDFVSVTGLLQKYGRYVRDAVILYSRNRNLLHDWLSVMPNIRKLRINTIPFSLLDGRWVPADQKFPNFKHLKELYVDRVPFPVLKKLIEQNSQITVLTLAGYSNEVAKKISELYLPNLKKLTRVKGKYESSPSRELLELTAKLQQCKTSVTMDFFLYFLALIVLISSFLVIPGNAFGREWYSSWMTWLMSKLLEI